MPRAIKNMLFHTLALAISAVVLLPLVWMISGSLRQVGLPPPRTVEWLPWPPAWQNYATIFQLAPLGGYALNSLKIVALAVPLTLLTASWAGFALAQLGPRAQRRLLWLGVVLMLVPITALWLTRFVMFTALHLIDSHLTLLAPALMGSSPFFVLLFYLSFRRIPLELFESARVDGAGALRIWARIALPLARPTIVVVAMLAFVLYWSDFMSPLLYLKSDRTYTLPVGLQLLQQMDRTNWPLLMAGAVVVVVPVVLAFLLAQRQFWAHERLSGFR